MDATGVEVSSLRGYEGGRTGLSSSANDCGEVIGSGGALCWDGDSAAVLRDRF